VGIVVRNLSKRFGSFQAVDGVSFEVPAGQLVALLGPSGSGKSTILRIIAGLEPADSGDVELTGEDATNLPAQERGVGFVFQHYALFRHMTVRQNVAFGLEVQKPRPPRAEVRRRVDELLDLVQLLGYADRYPSQLSGGQRQRVALARALAPRPKVLLLDEPFGALDARVRDELRTWLRKLHDEVHVTSLFVTHDQQEAFEVSDQIVVLNKGMVEQMGPPQWLYEHPATPFVTEFLGAVNVLKVETVLGMDQLGDEEPLPMDIPGPGAALPGSPPASVYVRPHDFDIARARNGRPAWTARVHRLTPLGGLVKLDLTLLDGTSLNVQLTRERCLELNLAEGENVFVSPKDLKVFTESKAFVENYVI
jgi:sulfate transport system ATP-binding protein